MTTPDINPETPPKTPETAPKAMTFEKLHEGIAADCDCLAVGQCKEDCGNTYARRVQKSKPDIDDFQSYQEERGDPNKADCDYLCKWRGVSINLITENNEQDVIEEWKSIISHKPKKLKSSIYCKFKLKQNAGMVAPAASGSSAVQKSHCNLFKCDDFSFDRLEVIQVISLA